jgi:hypothetical protein
MSNRADPPVRLPPAAEQLLESWPVPEKDEREWEQVAESIEARIAMVRPGSTEDALLAPPLPAPSTNGGSSISLAELARSVAAESAAHDAEELARETLSVASRARASAPLVPDLTRLEAAPASVPEPVPASAPVRAERPPPKRSKAGPMIAAGLAVIGMAAAAVIVIRHQQQAEVPVAAATVPAPDHAPEPSAAAPAPAAQPAEPETVSPEALAQADDKPRAPAAAAPMPGGSKPVEAPKVAAQAEPEEPAKAPEVQAKDEAEAAKMKPAAQPMDVAQQPSNGAAQAAVAQVIGSARACVAGHETPSRATLVFGSDGRVQSVSVSGPAAGTPAEACIRAALSRARVEPFAKPTFSVGATVRP